MPSYLDRVQRLCGASGHSYIFERGFNSDVESHHILHNSQLIANEVAMKKIVAVKSAKDFHCIYFDLSNT